MQLGINSFALSRTEIDVAQLEFESYQSATRRLFTDDYEPLISLTEANHNI